MSKTIYNRILIKLSGAALAGKENLGLDPTAVDYIVKEILAVRDLGVQVGIVVGGGNIFRGNLSDIWGIVKAEADMIGIAATVINCMVLETALKSRSNYEVRVMTSVHMPAVAEPYIRLKALKHLDTGRIVIYGGGIGQPFLTTDYAAIQRAIETNCEAVFVAKHGVNGVYSADPNLDENAQKFDKISYNEVIAKNLKVMDPAAIILAQEYAMKLNIFNFSEAETMVKLLKGEKIGTTIYE
ncbi:MAG: UMP kinase [Deltaproteobacteria bacterium]|jgi:uridylate kinase|nr:UMP kinase [Deltaproteobacteria bacterium]